MKNGKMMKRGRLRAGVAAWLAAALLAAGPAALAQSADKAQRDFNNRMESVKVLNDALKRKAAEKGVNRADVSAKVELRLREAASLAAAGEFGLGRSVLDEAYQIVKLALDDLLDAGGTAAGAKPAAAAGGSAEKKKRDFDNRAQSVAALREALVRKGAEKGGNVSGALAQVDAKAKEGNAAAAAGDYDRGKAAMDEAYQIVKLALDQMLDAGGTAAGSKAAASTAESRQEFDARVRTVRTLNDALKRMSGERGVNNAEVIAKVETLAGQAVAAAGSDPERGRGLIDEAYATVKAAIEKLRSS